MERNFPRQKKQGGFQSQGGLQKQDMSKVGSIRAERPSAHSDTSTVSLTSNLVGHWGMSKRDISTLDVSKLQTQPRQTAPSANSNMSPTSSFTAKRSVVNPGTPTIGEKAVSNGFASIPIDTNATKPSRKLPPAPLNLGNSKPDNSSFKRPSAHSDIRTVSLLPQQHQKRTGKLRALPILPQQHQ